MTIAESDTLSPEYEINDINDKNNNNNINIKKQLEQNISTISSSLVYCCCCNKQIVETLKNLESNENSSDGVLTSSSSILALECDILSLETIECNSCQRLNKKLRRNSATTTNSGVDFSQEVISLPSTPQTHQPQSPTTTSSSSVINNSCHNRQIAHESQIKNKINLLNTASIVASTEMGRKYIGSLVVLLPEGTILDCVSAKNNETDTSLLNILHPGDCLLLFLQGKGAQTMLLNAFCGHTKRRMYARLKWGESGEVRACEFLCEFSVDLQNTAKRIANIQVFCVNTSLYFASSNPMGINLASATINTNNIMSHSVNLLNQIFTTRHNSSCAVIYLDSASIPILGHFPSEITGKSLFALIHSDDVEAVICAHQELRKASGGEIISTPGLRFITYVGNAVHVNSEWSAFVNPWTHQIEMIVGRHVLIEPHINNNHQQIDTKFLLDTKAILMHDSIVHDILSKPAQNLLQKNQQNQQQQCLSPLVCAQEKKTLGFTKFEDAQLLTSFVTDSSPSNNILTTLINEKNINGITTDKLLENTDLNVVNINNSNYNNNVVTYPTFNNIVNNNSFVDEESQKQKTVDHTLAAKLTSTSETLIPEICLSYSQINCLENVHRLLKSQAKEKKEMTTAASFGEFENNSYNIDTPPLTRELLEQHNRKWETECKYSWKRRLTLKRIAQSPLSLPPTPKAFRHSAEDTARSKSAFIEENNNHNNKNNNNNNNNVDLCYSPVIQQSQIECLSSCQVFQNTIDNENTSGELRHATSSSKISSLPSIQNPTSAFSADNIKNNFMSSILNFSFKSLLQQQQQQQLFVQNLTAQQFLPNSTSVVNNNNNNNNKWNNYLIAALQSQIQIMAKQQQKQTQQLTESQIFLLGNLLLNHRQQINSLQDQQHQQQKQHQ